MLQDFSEQRKANLDSSDNDKLTTASRSSNQLVVQTVNEQQNEQNNGLEFPSTWPPT